MDKLENLNDHLVVLSGHIDFNSGNLKLKLHVQTSAVYKYLRFELNLPVRSSSLIFNLPG